MKNLVMWGGVCMVVTACAAPGVTPEKANLFEAMGNLQSGEFDKQLERKKLDLQVSRTELATEQQQQKSLQAELLAKQQELAMLEAELTDVTQQNLALEQMIHREQAKNKQKQAQWKAMLSKVNTIKQELAGIERKQKEMLAKADSPKKPAPVKPDKLQQAKIDAPATNVAEDASEYRKRINDLADASEYRKRVAALKQEVQSLQVLAQNTSAE